jgi:hypothetical protein
MLWKYCILMYKNGKMRPVETIPGMGWGNYKREWWKGWIQLRYIVWTSVNVTTYPSYDSYMIIKNRNKIKNG